MSKSTYTTLICLGLMVGYIAGVLTGQLKKSIPPETPKFTISTKCYSGGVLIYEHKGGYVSTGSLEALAIKDGDRKTLITNGCIVEE